MVQKFSYNWLTEYLGATAPTPEAVADLLTKHAFEVEGMEKIDGDTLIELKILPDRGSDCLCHRGIARELATLINQPLQSDPLEIEVLLPITDKIVVEIEDADDCPRFTASLITGITVADSPLWLKERLAAVGVRSINNIIDATNYVMFAIGQPLHAYDAAKFPQKDGAYNFVVRKAVAAETVNLLAEGGKEDERIVSLKGGELLIVEGAGNTAVGLAGVKGGRFAGVDSSTNSIIIEAAHFDAGLTRRTARGLGIIIDASKRFENEPARTLPPLAQQNIVDLIIKIAGGECVGFVDVYLTEKNPQPVLVSPMNVNALLGLNVPVSEMVSLLKRGGVTVAQDGQSLLCTGPLARTDLNIEEDFIEEIGRVYGYHHVVSVVPEKMVLTEFNQRHIFCEKVRLSLLIMGFTEVITTTFRNKDEIGLLSSMASDKCFLRSELATGLEEALTKNAPFTDLLGTAHTSLFEIGTVFTRVDGVVAEHFSLVIGVRLKTTGYSGKEDALLLQTVRQLEADLGIKGNWLMAAGLAELNLSELISKLPTSNQYVSVPKTEDITYSPFSIYPSSSRDIALWVGTDTEVSSVATLFKEAASDLLVRVTHLDTFAKDSKVSLAFRLVFQSNDKTLAADEVEAEMTAVYQACARASFEVR